MDSSPSYSDQPPPARKPSTTKNGANSANSSSANANAEASSSAAANKGGGSGIVRVNRACKHCRKLKMRCDFGESNDPPCKRCRHTGQECILEKPSKGGAGGGGGGGGGLEVGDDRIRHLESQVTSIQSTLADLVTAIKSTVLPPAHGPGSYGESPASAGSHHSHHGQQGYPPQQLQHPPGGYYDYQNVGIPGHTGEVDFGPPHMDIHRGSIQGMMNPPLSSHPALMPFPHRTSSVSGSNIPGHGLGPPPQQQRYSSSDVLAGEIGPSAETSPFDALLAGIPSAGSTGRFDFDANTGRQGVSPGGGLEELLRAAGSGGVAGRSAGGGGEEGASAQWGNGRRSPGNMGQTGIDTLRGDMEVLMQTGGGPGNSGGYGGSGGGLPTGLPSRLRAHSTAFPNGEIASPALSDDEDPQMQMLRGENFMAPLGMMDQLAAAAVERARSERTIGDGKLDTGLMGEGEEGEDGRAGGPKRRKLGEGEGESGAGRKGKGKEGEVRFAIPSNPGGGLGNLTTVSTSGPTMGGGKGKKKKEHIHAYPDVVAMGLIKEEEGKQLFTQFFSGSHTFVPVYDKSNDTWDSLRIRSPFSISTICSIAARVRDGGGPMSQTQRACLDHARKISLGTIYHPVNRVEAVQATLLLAAFNDNGWLIGGHACRMAIDMGLDKCFMKLIRGNMGRGRSGAELESDRPLVVGARVYFALYLMEHQMSYGTGRQAILREDDTIQQCRQFLDHPLSIISDVRLISSVELVALRSPLHISLTTSPEDPLDHRMVKELQSANISFDEWQVHWDRVFDDRCGKDRGDFYRESILIQREYSSLFINSQLLRGVGEAADVGKLSPEKRALAVRAMRNAQTCLDICIRGINYPTALKYAVHYTHVCAAFAASFLIRIARLFPQELDLRRTAKDVEALASILSEVPAGRYARSLRLLLRKARKQKIIPPPSVPTSPKRASASLSTPFAPAPGTPLHPSPSPTSIYGAGSNPLLQSALAASNASLALTGQSGQMASPGLGGMGLKDESPLSAGEGFGEFDQGYVQDLMAQAGMAFGDNREVPLFFNAESLGAADTSINAVGLENFFLPADVDMRLGDFPGVAGGNVSGDSGLGMDPAFPAGAWPYDDSNNVWW